MIAALRTMAPGIGASALAHLRAPQPPPIETVLSTLRNGFGAIPNDIVLVLDDRHRRARRAGGDGFLLDHLPPQ
ncbi:MAG: hypothetical protein ACXV2G_01200, partial [Actinomycetes bacterium]